MTSPRPFGRTAALLVAVLLLQARATSADEVIVMTSGTFTAASLELAPAFERAAKHKVVIATTTIGVGADSIPNRLLRKEPADVVIMSVEGLEALIKVGSVVPGSRVDLARSSVAMAVRSGARKPDIGSVEALKRTLVEATSVAYSASTSGDYLVKELFPKLGIAGQMARTARRIVGERVGAVIARGEAEIGFQQLSELLPIAGIDVVGPLPAEVQLVTVAAAGVTTHSKNPDAARAFIRFLASAEASSVVVKTGLELLAPR
jgi:molybdate transport system substrate-binding protein